MIRRVLKRVIEFINSNKNKKICESAADFLCQLGDEEF